MENTKWQERIVVDPNVHQGDPCIRDTCIPVAAIIGSIANKQSPNEILRAYPELTPEDIWAALAYVDDILYQNNLLSKPAKNNKD